MANWVSLVITYLITGLILAGLFSGDEHLKTKSVLRLIYVVLFWPVFLALLFVR